MRAIIVNVTSFILIRILEATDMSCKNLGNRNNN